MTSDKNSCKLTWIIYKKEWQLNKYKRLAQILLPKKPKCLLDWNNNDEESKTLSCKISDSKQ